jgi:hypothetical protein
VVRDEKVGEATGGDGECVGEKDRHAERVDEESHEEEIAEERDEAVGEMEAQELCERFARAALRFCWPGVVEMPEEVVEERELDGEGGGEEVVCGECVVENGECGELRDDAEEADEVEA